MRHEGWARSAGLRPLSRIRLSVPQKRPSGRVPPCRTFIVFAGQKDDVCAVRRLVLVERRQKHGV